MAYPPSHDIYIIFISAISRLILFPPKNANPPPPPPYPPHSNIRILRHFSHQLPQLPVLSHGTASLVDPKLHAQHAQHVAHADALHPGVIKQSADTIK